MKQEEKDSKDHVRALHLRAMAHITLRLKAPGLRKAAPGASSRAPRP